jgi:hypothetical protein
MERIVAVVVDSQMLTLYREDGSKIEVPQGDPRVRKIVAEVIPVVDAQGIAEIDFSPENHYNEFEKQGSGLIRLFRVAKKAVAQLLNPATVETGLHGQVPAMLRPGESISEPDPSKMAAVEEIVSNAQAVGDVNYREPTPEGDDTMIAVVGKGKKAKIVPGVEKLKQQFRYSAKMGSTVGLERFLSRAAAIIDQRPHSVQDLLTFLERGDLPIADDGCIVAYKRLYSQKNERFVDPHTRKVSQKVGSYVCVDQKLVDLSRGRECSNGLHIGRRAYMGSFSGDAIMMCKIDPEDVMVVPHGDPNKVRVKGYHIVAQLNERAFDLVNRNQPATSDEQTAKLLSDVIAGRHVARLEEVRVHGQMGTDVRITALVGQEKGVEKSEFKVDQEAFEASRKKHLAVDDERIADPVSMTSKPLDPRKVAQAQSGSRQGQAKLLWNTMRDAKTPEAEKLAAQALLDFKKKAKVAWGVLGIDDAMLATIKANAEKVIQSKPSPPPKPRSRTNSKSAVSTAKKIVKQAEKAQPKVTKTARAEPKAKPVKPVAVAEVARLLLLGPSQQAARNLYERQKWGSLLDFKQMKKKSWAALGFNATEEALIKEKTNGMR